MGGELEGSAALRELAAVGDDHRLGGLARLRAHRLVRVRVRVGVRVGVGVRVRVVRDGSRQP